MSSAFVWYVSLLIMETDLHWDYFCSMDCKVNGYRRVTALFELTAAFSKLAAGNRCVKIACVLIFYLSYDDTTCDESESCQICDEPREMKTSNKADLAKNMFNLSLMCLFTNNKSSK